MATECPICFLSGGTFKISEHRIDGQIVHRVHPELFHLHCLREIRYSRCPMCRDVMVLPDNGACHLLRQTLSAICRAVRPLLTMRWWKEHIQRLAETVCRAVKPLFAMASGKRLTQQ
jgi:hypothetical protein